DCVGYVKTEEVCGVFSLWRDSARFWMTPTYAVAASGAAADSSSLEFSVVVEDLLQVFNLDLGYYIDGWSRGFVSGDDHVVANRAADLAISPFFLHTVIEWVASLGSTGSCNTAWMHGHQQTLEGRKYYITDGGHFDNSGVYGLVRRGCRTIIVSDGSGDSEVANWDQGEPDQRARAFGDLHEVERKLFADFGADLEFDWSKFSQDSPVLIGHIKNLPIDGDPRPVTIIWIKSAARLNEFPRSMQAFIDEFAAADPNFPHDSLIEQFFSERQLLAYRALGRQITLDYWKEHTDAPRPRSCPEFGP
ncbi:MAG TPA: hypothetical protein PLV92_28195, partial [Pirellulaceae bacterium]|nr:hypothetical protein [Pirellulaceae bacterium]